MVRGGPGRFPRADDPLPPPPAPGPRPSQKWASAGRYWVAALSSALGAETTPWSALPGCPGSGDRTGAGGREAAPAGHSRGLGAGSRLSAHLTLPALLCTHRTQPEPGSCRPGHEDLLPKLQPEVVPRYPEVAFAQAFSHSAWPGTRWPEPIYGAGPRKLMDLSGGFKWDVWNLTVKGARPAPHRPTPGGLPSSPCLQADCCCGALQPVRESPDGCRTQPSSPNRGGHLVN